MTEEGSSKPRNEMNEDIKQLVITRIEAQMSPQFKTFHRRRREFGYGRDDKTR